MTSYYTTQIVTIKDMKIFGPMKTMTSDIYKIMNSYAVLHFFNICRKKRLHSTYCYEKQN